MNTNVEIFKECEDGKLSMEEVAVIKDIYYRYFNDRANGYVAFALSNFYSREDADNFVDKLNDICVKLGEEPNWFLGDEEEEYVFVN